MKSKRMSVAAAFKCAVAQIPPTMSLRPAASEPLVALTKYYYYYYYYHNNYY